MSADIFGYNRNVNTKAILSSENCALDFGEGRVALVQNATLNYQHTVSPVYEAGSSDIYFVNGGAQGSLNFGSLVGRQGFFAGFNLGKQACGDLSTLSIAAVTEDGCSVKLEKNNAIRIEGALLQSVELSFNAGQYQVSQTGNFVVGKISVTSS